MAAAWPGIFVHESNFKVNMHSLRRSLGDTQKQPLYIATIAGRGYRFVAPVQRGAADIADAGIAVEAGEPGRLRCRFRRFLAARYRRARAGDRPCARPVAGQVAGDRRRGGGNRQDDRGRRRSARFRSGLPGRRCASSICRRWTIRRSLPSALVAALGLRGDMGDALTAVVDHLRQRSILVLLDNCEHVLPAVAIFARKLGGQPGKAKLLATSREPLGVPSENVMRLDTLASLPTALPPPSTMSCGFPPWSCLSAERPSGPDISSPMPIALSSPRSAVRSMGFRWPSSWWRASWTSTRRKSWSRWWTSISAFTTIAPMRRRRGTRRCWPRSTGASACCRRTKPRSSAWCRSLSAPSTWKMSWRSPRRSDLGPFDVIAGLGGLVAKSLLAAQVNGAGLRYRLLDSTRRYATRRRHEAGLDAQARHSHARRILALFEQSEAEWGWRDSDDWTQSYLGRAGDVQAALAWAFGDGGDAALGVRLTVATIPLWFETSLISEAQGRVEVALEHAETLRCDDLLQDEARDVPCLEHDVWPDVRGRGRERLAHGHCVRKACGQPRLRAAGAGRSFHLSDAHRTHRQFDRAARGVPRDLRPTSGLVPGSGRRAHAGLGKGAHGRADGKPGDARRAGGNPFASRQGIADGRLPGRPLYRHSLLHSLHCLGERAPGPCGGRCARCDRGGGRSRPSGIEVERAGGGGLSGGLLERRPGHARALHDQAAVHPGKGDDRTVGSDPAIFRGSPR